MTLRTAASAPGEPSVPMTIAFMAAAYASPGPRASGRTPEPRPPALARTTGRADAPTSGEDDPQRAAPFRAAYPGVCRRLPRARRARFGRHRGHDLDRRAAHHARRPRSDELAG